MAIAGRASIAGIDLAAAVEASPISIACVLGTNDIFASRESVEPAMRKTACGRRLIVELPDALHVDLTVGREATRILDLLWAFLMRPESGSLS
jgi:hypothetical protein